MCISDGAFVKVLDNDTALRQRMHNFARLRLVVYQMVAAGADHTSPKTDAAHVKLMDSLEEAAQMIKEQGAPTGAALSEGEQMRERLDRLQTQVVAIAEHLKVGQGGS